MAVALATQHLPPRCSTRNKPSNRRAITEVLDMQHLIYVQSTQTDLKPKDRAALAKAWDTLEERKRILRGKPLPGSLKPIAKSKRKTIEPATFEMIPPPAQPNP